jgi:hypothetical protein
MAYTKYSLTPANNNAAPPDGAPEGMLPSAVNDTMRDMMAQIRDVGDGIRGGTYTMTAPVITGGSITGSTINNSAIGGTTAAAGKFTTLEATGVTTVQAGTVSAPAITTTGDTNTGIYFPAADTIAFTEGGTEAMRIDSSANVGIGTSPSYRLHVVTPATATAQTLSNISRTTSNWARFTNPEFSTDASMGLLLRVFPDSDARQGAGVLATGGAANGATNLSLFVSDGTSSSTSFAAYTVTGADTTHTWNRAAGTEAMRITSAGNIGIGTTSPVTISNYTVATINNAGTGSAVYLQQAGADKGRFIATASDVIVDTQAAIPLIFGTNSAERMRIDSSGNVGINTSGPSAKLTVNDSNPTRGIVGRFSNTAGSSQTGAQIQISQSAVQDWAFGQPAGVDAFAFWSGRDISSSDGTERMRITSGGNVLIGTTLNSWNASITTIGSGQCTHFETSSTTAAGVEIVVNSDGTSQNAIQVFSNSSGSTKMVVRSNGNVLNTNNSYGSLSDIKLKENIVDATPKLDKIMDVKVRNYNLIGDGLKQIGVVAQELEQVFPSLVDESIDRDAEGNDLGTTTKSVKYSVFVPMLIKAIQEQQTLIENLTTRLNALEGK